MGGGEEPFSSKDKLVAKMGEEGLKPSYKEEEQPKKPEDISVVISIGGKGGDPIDNPSWFTPKRLGEVIIGYAFFGEAILMVPPFAILGFIMKPLHLKGFSPVSRKLSGKKLSSEVEDTQVSDKRVVTLVRNEGFSDQTPNQVPSLHSLQLVIGAYSYWKAGKAIYHMLLSATTLLGGISIVAAFCLSNLYGFVALFGVGQLLFFATQSPVNYVCLHCVKPSLRPLSMALSTVLIHILGDVPSSPLVGILQVSSYPAWTDLMKRKSIKSPQVGRSLNEP